jgi:short-subunit dehydrogenase
MLPRRTGHIIGIGSTAEQRAFPDNAAYGASKCAQSALLRVLAEEIRADGVRVTRLTLGAVDTAIWDARPGFERSHMLTPVRIALAVLDLALAADPAEEHEMIPPRGHL